MVCSSQRWEDLPDFEFLTTIDLWVQMRGIPLPYVCEEVVNEIAQELGEVIELDFHEATSTQIAYIRVRIRFGITDCLRFFKAVRFDLGETVVIRFQYERLRRICSNCFRFTHHMNYCPYRQHLPGPRNVPVDPANDARERIVVHDEIHMSDMNSQSQVSDNSFPAPISQPPRVDTPPLNPEEIAKAIPYFQPSRVRNLHHFAVPIPEKALKRQQMSTGSNITPNYDYETTSRFTRKFEVGESSKKNEMGESSKRKNPADDQNKEESRNIKQKVYEHMDGDILKHLKKR